MKINSASAWACLALFISTALADVSFFNNPPRSDDPNDVDYSNNPVYSMSDSINIQWTSDFEKVTVLIEQLDNGFRPVLVDRQDNPGSVNWTVGYNEFNGRLNSNSMMRFLLYQVPTQNHVYSHFFNLTAPPPVSSTSSSSATSTPSADAPSVANHIAVSATPTTVATSTSTSSPTSQQTSSSPSSPFPSEPSSGVLNAGAVNSSPPASSPSASASGLDSATQAGLGVGLGVGIPLLGLLAAILFILLRRRNREKQSQNSSILPVAGKPPTTASTTASPIEGFAHQPQTHAVPILQAPPAPRNVVHLDPTNENGYAPPSAKLKPWPEAAVAGEGYGAYGRGRGLSEAPGDYGDVQGDGVFGVRELGAGRERSESELSGPKELPVLPQTPRTPGRREREVAAAVEEGRLRRVI